MIIYHFMTFFFLGGGRLMQWLELRKRKKYKGEISLRAST